MISGEKNTISSTVVKNCGTTALMLLSTCTVIIRLVNPPVRVCLQSVSVAITRKCVRLSPEYKCTDYTRVCAFVSCA